MATHHITKPNGRMPHFEGVRLTPEQRARLVAFCRGKSETAAAFALGTDRTTLGKMLDGIGVKASAVERLLARLP